MPKNFETATVYSLLSEPTDPFVFVDCTWKSDDTGCLHIFRAPSDGDRGSAAQVASFGAATQWMVHANAEVSQ